MESKLLILILVVLFIPLVLGSCDEGQVDINTASAEELDIIKWVGPVTASNIINSRPFESVDDLIRVSGIGEIKLQDIKTEGIACAEDREEIEEDTDVEEDNNTREVIEVKVLEKEVEKQEIKEINLNPKSINTGKNNSKLIKSDYALYGFIAFSVLIILLFILKTNRRYENEFGRDPNTRDVDSRSAW